MSAKAMRALPLLPAGIVAAARDIATSARVEREAFLADRMRLRATMQWFEVIGEATKKLPAEFPAAHPELPWRQRAAFRDKLIHDYFEVALAPARTTASREIPALLPRLEALSGVIDPKTDA